MRNMSWGDVRKATEGAPEPDSEISTTGNAPEEIGTVLAEINASGFSIDDKRRIADWLNRSIDCARRGMSFPDDLEGVPCVPGDEVVVPGGKTAKVIATSLSSVYVDLGGGGFPSSKFPASEVAHAIQVTPAECLKMFEDELGRCETESDRDAARERCVRMMRRSLGVLQ